MVTKTDEILAERSHTHGEYTVSARAAQQLKRAYRSTVVCYLNDAQAEAVEMILHKIARIITGDPNYRDHWDDISGYAQLVAERIYETERQGGAEETEEDEVWLCESTGILCVSATED